MVRLDPTFRLGRALALLVFALILSGLGLCQSAAQPAPGRVLAPAPLPTRLPRPLSSYDPAALPTQRLLKQQALQWKAEVEAARRGQFSAKAPVPPQVNPQFADLTTVPRPPLVGDSTR